MQDLGAGPPHVAGHFDKLLLQRVCVLGQLVQAEGPVGPSCIQLGLHRLPRGGGGEETRGQRVQGSLQVGSWPETKKQTNKKFKKKCSSDTFESSRTELTQSSLESQKSKKNKTTKNDDRLAPARPRSANDFYLICCVYPALRPCVSNECRVTTMQEEGGGRMRDGEGCGKVAEREDFTEQTG